MPNRDNLSIQSISVDSLAATPVSLPRRYNIFLVSAPSVAADVSPFTWQINLPADADSAIGDMAEFYVINRPFTGSTAGVLTIADSGGIPFYPASQDLSAVYPRWSIAIRKVASNMWRIAGGA